MILNLPPDQLNALIRELKKAGDKEIGGQLFGEQLAPSDFRLTNITFQKGNGLVARFFVDLKQAVRDAIQFFKSTGHRYSRFNYIGEWHSHPLFSVRPSEIDVQTMRDLVVDPDFNGNFAVLLIVRLEGRHFEFGAYLFDPQGNEQIITLETELE